MRKFIQKPIVLVLLGMVLAMAVVPVAAQAALTVNQIWKKIQPKADARYVLKSSPLPTGSPGPSGPMEIQVSLGQQYILGFGTLNAEDIGQWWFIGCAGCSPGSPRYENGALVAGDNYPSSPSARFEVVLWLRNQVPTDRSVCVRLFDVTAGTPVAGSEVCQNLAADTLLNGGTFGERLRSGSFSISPDVHEYNYQVKLDDESPSNTVYIGPARLILSW